MKKILLTFSVFSFIILFSSCTENYSNGERIGMVTQFSHTGVWNKSWEGHLNLTQTGMNSSSNTPFDFSIDNDNEDTAIIKKLDSAAQLGWKIKLVYHEVKGKNWFNNRGHTDYFVSSVQVLDKDPIGNIFGNSKANLTQLNNDTTLHQKGHVIDTIYVVIIPKDKIKD